MKKILLIAIFFLAFFLRFYQLGEVPVGFMNDEASLGYDAYSILKTGKDQWNVFLPLSFKEFGDYRLPAYIYLTVIPVKIFGLNEFAVRFPSALLGVISIIIIYFLVKKIFNIKNLALFCSFLFAISPWSIGLSRIAIESNIAITFFLLGLLSFLKSLDNKKYLYLSIIFFVLTVYSYSAYTLFTPLVFLLLYYFYRTHLQTKEILISMLLFTFLIAPIFIGNKTTAGVRFSQVGIFTNVNSIGLKNVLNDKRGECLKHYPSLICKVVENKPVLFLNNFTQNYFSHFSFNFLYINGTPTQYSILPERGLEFMFEAIFLVIGFVSIFLKRKKEGLLLFSMFLVSPISDSLTGGGHYARASLMLPFLAIIEGLGLYQSFSFVKNVKFKPLKYSLLIGSGFLFFFAVLSFSTNYLTYFNNYYSTYSHYGHKALMNDVYNEQNNFDRIYISRRFYDTKQYIFYLFFNSYDPQVYQKKTNVSYGLSSDGWISIDRIDNIYFVENLPSIPQKSELAKQKILLIGNPADFPKTIKSKNEIKDRLGNIIFKEVELKERLKFY